MKNIMRQHRVVASATNTPSNVGVGRNLALLGRFTNRAKSLLIGGVMAFAIAGCGGGGGSDSGGGASTEPTPAPVVIDISLSSSTIAENSLADTFVGTISTTNMGSGVISYSFGGGVDDTNFTIDENNLSINISPDFETKSSYSIDITADDGEKNFTKTLTISITDINEAPTDLNITNKTIDENIPDGTTVATLTTNDVDIADSFTYSFDGGADDSSFSISGDKLSIKSSPNFEPKSTYDIKLKATDSGGLMTIKSFTITINNINEAPTDLNITNNTIDENVPDGTTIGTLSANDQDSGDSLSYSLDGSGADDSHFTITNNILTINSSPNFEFNPSYSIKLKATDTSGLSTTKDFVITIGDINEAPIDLNITNKTIDENVPNGTTIGILSATDQDSGDSLTYSFDGGTDDSYFSISGDNLNIKISPNFEAKSSYNIKLKTTDTDGLTETKDFTITINDINEQPTDIQLSNTTIDENVPDGTVVGTLSATDPENYTLYYYFANGIDDSYFTIDGNKLKIKSSPNFELKSTYNIKLKAIDSGGLTTTKDFVITIDDIFEPFILKIKSDNNGSSMDNEFEVPTRPELTYNYDIDCDYDGTFDATATGQTGDYTCSYGAVGEYSVAIIGDFPAIHFSFYGTTNPTDDNPKLLEIQAWGEIEWSTMREAFRQTENMTTTAADKPDLRNVTDMSNMFSGADKFNGDIGDWDVSNVTDMSYMFSNTDKFNQDIGDWNVSSVTDMRGVFNGADAFNQDIGGWNVSNVTDMRVMFSSADVFNQDINDWNVSNVTGMTAMFSRAKKFNQHLYNWDVSNVTNMSHMFNGATAFDSWIGNWDTSNVTSMSYMFQYAINFNDNIEDWDVSNVTNMDSMFRGATNFNCSNNSNAQINLWNVEKVTNMKNMFNGATSFDRLVYHIPNTQTGWDLSKVTVWDDFGKDSGLEEGEIPGKFQ